MATVISTSTSEVFKSKDVVDTLKQELKDYMKRIHGKPEVFDEITHYTLVDGARLDDCCAPIDAPIQRLIYAHVAKRILFGNMKYNGKTNNWSV